jgi:predicted transcriptional regulator of viral defense system
MQYSEFLTLLKANGIAVFTVSDAAKMLGKTNQYAAKFLQKRNGIEHIEKGKYCISGASEDAIASHIVYPGYLSLISALRYYNLTTQIPKEKYVITTVRHKPLLFHNYVIRFIRVNKKLMFGFGEVNGVSVAYPEKAFIDVLYLKKEMWYTEEFEEGLEKGVVSIKKMEEYAARIGSRQLEKRFESFIKSRSLKERQDKNRASTEDTALLKGARIKA